jgi:hypothetical protein
MKSRGGVFPKQQQSFLGRGHERGVKKKRRNGGRGHRPRRGSRKRSEEVPTIFNKEE